MDGNHFLHYQTGRVDSNTGTAPLRHSEARLSDSSMRIDNHRPPASSGGPSSAAFGQFNNPNWYHRPSDLGPPMQNQQSFAEDCHFQDLLSPPPTVESSRGRYGSISSDDGLRRSVSTSAIRQLRNSEMKRKLATRRARSRSIDSRGTCVEQQEQQEQQDDAAGEDLPPRFACPYLKYDHMVYGCRRTCGGPVGFPTIHRLKYHLHRSHKLIECGRCRTIFETLEARAEHQQEEHGCIPRQTPKFDPVDGFNSETGKKIKSKKGLKGKAEGERWVVIYKTLFPDVKSEDIPDPYLPDLYKLGKEAMLKKVQTDLLPKVDHGLNSLLYLNQQLKKSVMNLLATTIIELAALDKVPTESITTTSESMPQLEIPFHPPPFRERLLSYSPVDTLTALKTPYQSSQGSSSMVSPLAAPTTPSGLAISPGLSAYAGDVGNIPPFQLTIDDEDSNKQAESQQLQAIGDWAQISQPMTAMGAQRLGDLDDTGPSYWNDGAIPGAVPDFGFPINPHLHTFDTGMPDTSMPESFDAPMHTQQEFSSDIWDLRMDRHVKQHHPGRR